MKNEKFHILILTIVCLLAFFMGNRFKPVDIMEGRNLATANEMVVYGNYFIPTLNGELRLEKPPLPTWGASVVERLWPGDIVAQRALSCFIGWLWVVFAYLLVRRLSPISIYAFWCALILATCYSVMFMARNATWDIWCHALMTMGMFFYVSGINSKNKGILNFLVAGFLMGLSFLSKGPVAFYSLLLPFLVSYHMIFKPSLKGNRINISLMVLVCIIVSSLWYIYLYCFELDKLSFTIAKETAAWKEHSTRPWYYYNLFFVESGIWSLFWLTAMISCLFFAWYKKDKLLCMGTLWSVLALILLSLPPEKKTRYLLPLMLPCALTVSGGFTALQMQLRSQFTRIPGLKLFKIVVWTVSVILILAALGIIFYPFGIKITIYLYLLSFIFIVAGVWMIYCNWRKTNIGVIVFSCVVVMCGISVLGLPTIYGVIVNKQHYSILHLREKEEFKNIKTFHPAAEGIRPEIVYASGRRIQKLNLNSVLEIKENLPFLLMISGDIKDYPLLNNFKKELVGVYDNNWKQPNSKNYSQSLKKEVWLKSN